MNDSRIEYQTLQAVTRAANAVERIANVLEGRESGAQLDRIKSIHDGWLASSVNPGEAFPHTLAAMRRIGELLNGGRDAAE